VPTLDLSFPIQGERVPRDHGYALYGALSRAIPALHGASWLGVHPLGGALADDATLLFGRHPHLRLRLPADRIADVLPLAGARLDVGGAALRLGAPRVHALAPVASLDARMAANTRSSVARRSMSQAFWSATRRRSDGSSILSASGSPSNCADGVA
jgi:CRISPR-associated protein Cas6